MNQTIVLYILTTIFCPIYFFCACAKINVTLQKTSHLTHFVLITQIQIQTGTKKPTNRHSLPVVIFLAAKISVCGITLMLSAAVRCVNYNLIGEIGIYLYTKLTDVRVFGNDLIIVFNN